MSSDRDENIEDLFPFYALGTLTEEESRQVEEYLRNNPEAQVRLQEMVEVASALVYAEDPVKPPAGAKQTLVSRVQEQASSAVSTAGPISEPRPPGRSRWVPALLGLSLLVAAVSGTLGVRQTLELSSLQTDLVDLQRKIEQQDELITRIVAPSVQRIDVAGTDVQPEAQGKLYSDPASPSSALVVWGLSPLDPAQAYQVWLIAGETPVSVGLLGSRQNGLATHLIDAESPLGTFDALGISIEPLGGSVLPTGAIVMLAELGN